MANKDFRVAVGFFRHLKTRKAIRRLGIPAAYAFLAFLGYVAENMPTGFLGDMSDQDVADAADYEGDAGQLLACWTDIGWIDEHDNGRAVHDWSEHNGYAAAAPERSEKAREAALVKHGKKPAPRRSPARRTKAHAPSMPDAESSSAPSPSPSPSPNPTPSPSPLPDREVAHAREAIAPADEPEVLEVIVEAAPASAPAPAPRGIPKGPAVPYSSEVLAAVAAVLPAIACVRPDQVPAVITSHLRTEYPQDDNPHVWAIWRDLGPEKQAAWCAEALGREEVKAKPDHLRMRSAARHIGKALHDGFDLLAEQRAPKVVNHPGGLALPGVNFPGQRSGRMTTQQTTMAVLRGAAAKLAGGAG